MSMWYEIGEKLINLDFVHKVEKGLDKIYFIYGLGEYDWGEFEDPGNEHYDRIVHKLNVLARATSKEL